MDRDQLTVPALALAQFASATAAFAVAALQRQGNISQKEADLIFENLKLCQQLLCDEAGLKKHGEFLEDVLRSFSAEKM